MKLVIQRVKSASVTVNNEVIGKINAGLLVFLGINQSDTATESSHLINKLLKLRLFPGGVRSMDRSVVECTYEILIVSQFTLYADCSKGNRPSFSKAMAPDKAEKLYDEFVQQLRNQYNKVETGQFGAYMDVQLVNDGPITIVLES